jgi:valyl-tRNA synthetase
VVRASSEFNSLPWTNAAISGWILDPDRKKMSKSKGNVVTPIDMLIEYGSDAVRYWSASSRPGTDTAFDIGQMKIGRRLAIKLLNASKFVLGVGVEHSAAFDQAAVTEPLDQALLARLADVVAEATTSFDNYDYARALQLTETFFWTFTDDYVELIKDRAYGGRGPAGEASAKATLATALSTLLRLFAPTLPFVTEEVWSWWQEGSVHRAAWPVADDVRALAGSADPATIEVVGAALSGIRKAKSEAKQSMRAEVSLATINATDAQAALITLGAADIKAAGVVTELVINGGASELSVAVELAPLPPAE